MIRVRLDITVDMPEKHVGDHHKRSRLVEAAMKAALQVQFSPGYDAPQEGTVLSIAGHPLATYRYGIKDDPT